jgi:hypothetical protein
MAARDHEAVLSARARMVAVVIVFTMVLWMGGQWVGAQSGVATRWLFLLDFAALAALFWSLFVAWQIWRRRREAD